MFEQAAGGEGRGRDAGAGHTLLLDRVRAAVDELAASDSARLDDLALRQELAALERLRRQVHARISTLTATLTSRSAERARREHPGDPRRAERAARDEQAALAGEHGWTPSEAKEHRHLGETLRQAPAVARAAADGALPPGHTAHLQRTLRQLVGADRRTAEDRLLAAAGKQDVATFARTCQQVLAELDAASLERAEERRQARRRANLNRTPDGMTSLYGEWAGMDAETVETGIDAFRRPDAPGEHRTPDQRTADAVVDMARAALRGEAAPTQHGTRPHVVVTVAAEDLKTHDAGEQDPDRPAFVTLGSGRRALLAAVRRYLDDANWSWIVVDPDGVPIEAGAETPAVPVALWRGLVLRDGGCIAAGCDRKPEWCDVMHLGTWRKDGGRLTLDTAGLGCRTHHRLFDHGGWVITWHGRRPILRPPNERPRAGPDPGG